MKKPLVFEKKKEVRAWVKEQHAQNRTVGFVPTMGALHVGHRSLLERSAKENELTVVSIFVNPIQFGPSDDFHAYPRPFEADLKLCAEAGVDCVFAPSAEEMYDGERRTFVEVGGLTDNLCGLSRPGHFRGVATIVAKLLNIIRPDRAYFGRKDAQQLRIIRAMAKDLDLPGEIVPCETVREADGLAVSSRNDYLNPKERAQAAILSKALQHCRRRVEQDAERDAMKLMGEMAEMILGLIGTEIDYVALVDADSLADLKHLRGRVLVALAVKIGKARLIDNITLDVKPH